MYVQKIEILLFSIYRKRLKIRRIVKRSERRRNLDA